MLQIDSNNVLVQAYSNIFTIITLLIWQRYNPASRINIGTRNSFLKLKQPSRRTKQGQNCLSFIGPSTWNRLPTNIKDSNNVNSFKHKLKTIY